MYDADAVVYHLNGSQIASQTPVDFDQDTCACDIASKQYISQYAPLY